jgi:hypothetical protein
MARSEESSYWWESSRQRPVWVEITKRPNDDIGIDLNHSKDSPLAYELLGEPRPGDKVLHWDSKRGQFVGVSTVTGSAYTNGTSRFVELNDFTGLPLGSLTLESIRKHGQALRRIRDSLSSTGKKPYFPFQPYGEPGWDLIRPALAYLTAAPQELVQLLGGIYEGHRDSSPLMPSWKSLGLGSASQGINAAKSEVNKIAFDRYVQANEEIELTNSGKPKAPDLELLQAGFRAHNQLQNKFAKWLIQQGFTPVSQRAMDDYAADLRWEAENMLFVAEVKSMTAKNRMSQLRKGIGQVLHYQQLAMMKNPELKVVPVLVVPSDPGPEWRNLCIRIGIKLVWPGKFSSVNKK